jgi:hypothetical protein
MKNSPVVVYIKIILHMEKNYSKALKITKRMKPDKEVVSLLLNYSKALKIVKIEDKVFEIIVN